MPRGKIVNDADIEASLGLLDDEHQNSDPAPIVDRSAVYRRLKGIGAWLLAERVIDQERKRLRALGRSRSESGELAWKLADREISTEAVLAGQQLHETLPKTPDGLTVQQATSWRLAIAILINATCRSSKLTSVAQRLVTQARLRTAMGNIGEYDLSKEAIEKSLSLLKASSESCIKEVDRIAAVIQKLDLDSIPDALADELTDLLDGLYIAREVIEDHWSTTGFALQPG